MNILFINSIKVEGELAIPKVIIEAHNVVRGPEDYLKDILRPNPESLEINSQFNLRGYQNS